VSFMLEKPGFCLTTMSLGVQNLCLDILCDMAMYQIIYYVRVRRLYLNEMLLPMTNQSLHVLLVEDDDVDAEIIQRAFKAYHTPYPLTHVHDGLEALEVLRGEHGRPRLAPPYVILLDIHLPRMNGIEFLRALRQDAALMWSIVFVLTISDHYENIVSAYREHVAGYFLKTKVNQHVAQLMYLLETYTLLGVFPSGLDKDS